MERNKISDEYRGIDDIFYIPMSQELSSINETRKILHWFHFSIPYNDAPKHDNDEGGIGVFLCHDVITT